MADRDIIVVGASAGGVEALRALSAGLPADLPACLLVVLHLPRSMPSALPAILQRTTKLAVRAAVDGEPIRHGRIYVAPVDRHILVVDHMVRLSRGATENGHRPAVDPLFRSAAHVFGPRVIGVVLSGSRDDGAAGLAAISRRGGLTVVQSPADALHPSMPLAALDSVSVDHVVPVSEMGPLLDRIVREPVPDRPIEEDPVLAAEVAIADLAALRSEEVFEAPAGYGCPACGGALYEIGGPGLMRFRCRVGHAWSADTLLEEQAAALEGALWMALRALEERGALSRRLAEGSGVLRSHRRSRYGDLADSVDESAATVRKLIEAITLTVDVDGAGSTP